MGLEIVGFQNLEKSYGFLYFLLPDSNTLIHDWRRMAVKIFNIFTHLKLQLILIFIIISLYLHKKILKHIKENLWILNIFLNF